MRRIPCGIALAGSQPGTSTWEALGLGSPWDELLHVLAPGATPRPVQIEAFARQRILESRRNLVVSAPTNAGKSQVGLLVLLDAVRQGRRTVLLEPLRAVAREKADELRSAAGDLSRVLGREVGIRISTGDYRLESETFSAPPPPGGEILVATPERLEAILRNPARSEWLDTLGAVCVDEAHLISSPHRGATLEYLITSLLSLPAPPRVVLLSATLGGLDRLADWLSPCRVVSVTERCPPLIREVWELEAGDDPSEVVRREAAAILADPNAALLVFVYQTRSAERLAKALCEEHGALLGTDGGLAYHSQMSAAHREVVRAAFSCGRSRCVVTTTALALGVNLPATHVIIRDSTFPGAGRLGLAELLQMTGRAGRGEQAGRAAVLVRPTDGWVAEELASALSSDVLPPIVSPFEAVGRAPHRAKPAGDPPAAVTDVVASHLSRRGDPGATVEELQRFFHRCLGGQAVVEQLPAALSWLCEPGRALAFQDDSGHCRLTVLGRRAVLSVLPLVVASGLGQLVRDLLSLDPLDQLLSRWRPLDHLLVLHLLSPNPPRLRSFSARLVDEVDAWMERSPDCVPMLFREWIVGERGRSRAAELMGSLGLTAERGAAAGDEWTRKQAYAAVFHSIVLYERAHGASATDLERRWAISDLEEVEERWRDEQLWLLSGVAKVLELRSFYFHLRGDCEAGPTRIRSTKRVLRLMRRQAYDLQEQLKYCSPLGPVLRSLRRTTVAQNERLIGTQSIRRLEEAGVRCLSDLAALSAEELVGMGISRNAAEQMRSYLRRCFQ